jgi:hypothetical protein
MELGHHSSECLEVWHPVVITKLDRHIGSKQLITCGPLSDQARWQRT